MHPLDFLATEEVKAFIKENVTKDTTDLLLHPPKKWRKEIKLLADQILARQKAKTKLPSWFGHPDLIFPPPLSIEQASSEKTAEYKAALVEGSHLIDLTGGMGVDCLAIGGQFCRVTYIEPQEILCETFRHNAQVLRREIAIKRQKAEDFISSYSGKAIFYMDPARRDKTHQKVFKLADCMPDITSLLPALNQKFEKCLIKLSPLIDITHVLRTLQNVLEVHIVSVKNDCKEVLLLLAPHKVGSTKIVAVNLGTDQKPFEFVREEEAKKSPLDLPKTFIYEPNASILKSGAFNVVANRWGIAKLHPNTHLYTADTIIDSFPGRIFQMVSPFNPSALQTYAPKGLINVLTRNHPLTSMQLCKKLKVKDGGDYFLIGFTDKNDKAQQIIARRIL